MADLRLLLWVALGGAIGAVLRYLLSVAIPTQQVPWSTLVVNVLGSFLLAFLLFHDLQRGTLTPSMRLFLGIGVLGAFTTMSTLSYETVALYAEGETTKAGLSAFVNLGASVAAAFFGRAVALWMADGTPT